MPPQTRGRKVSIASKENIGVVSKTKSKAVGKVTKQRKALADKTNSASDDNSSAEIIRKENCVVKEGNKKNLVATVPDAKSRPLRERKLPNRLNKNEILSNLSINKDSATPSSNHKYVNKKAVNNDSTLSSSFKTPQKVDNSLITNRPKRVCRLPSKFDDHSVSPNKFIPVGCYASTPIVQNKNTKSITDKTKVALTNVSDKVTSKYLKQTKLPNKKSPLKIPVETVTGADTSDSSNNAKHRQLRGKKVDSISEPQIPAEIVTGVATTDSNNAKSRQLRAKKVDSKNKPQIPAKIVTGVATTDSNNAKSKQLRAKKVDSVNEPQIPAETVTGVATSDSNNVKRRQLRAKKVDNVNEPQIPAEIVTVVATTDSNNAKSRQLRAKKVDNISEPQRSAETVSGVAASDSNNNAKPRQRVKKEDSNNKPQTSEKASPTNQKTGKKKLLEHNFSYRVLEDKQKPSKRDNSHLDVYEFTYDPNEEPPPQKKKRKRPVKKNPPKPKTVVFKNNYDQNMSKALAALKNVVTKKPLESQVSKPVNGQIKQASDPIVSSVNKPMAPNTREPAAPIITAPVITVTPAETSKATPSHPQPKPNASIRVEDIAADFEPLMDHDNIDYSPVTSPNRGKSPLPNTTTNDTIQHRTNHHDPLNLQDNFSFFDAVPVASSSMNTSVRRPHDSPWRVQFDQLPIKWHVNTYTKPNMTPAVESSFINFSDSNKMKHVYTNLVPESNDPLPEIVSNDQPDLKQTSIISFFREVAERSAKKRKRALSRTPTKGSSVFDDNPDMFVATNRDVYRTPNKTPRKEAADNYWTPNKVQEVQENTDKAGTSENNKNKVNTPKSKNKDGTFFGFDESADQENVSPVKIDNPRVRALRPRARAVLQEINAQSEPTRAKIPLAAKSKGVASSDAINKVYEEMKSATEAPVFPEKDTNKDNAMTDVGEQMTLQNEDSQSVHLFEDLELVHHLKPLRKSYGKAKKVTFQRTEASDSDTQSLDAPPQNEESDEEDDLADLTFAMPKVAQKNAVKKKTSKKKKQLSKKEKAEMEAWAAQFNSMCEDVEDFPLVVE